MLKFSSSAAYNSNQNLRLMFSCKFGQRHILKPVRSYTSFDCEMTDISDINFQEFKDSLVCDKNFVVNVYADCPIDDPVKSTRICCSTPTSLSTRYQHIDSFIKQLIGCGSIARAQVHENIDTGRPIIFYVIKNYSFCYNVNRPHRSNKIYFIADILKNVVYQRCHKCTNFRSEDIVIE